MTAIYMPREGKPELLNELPTYERLCELVDGLLEGVGILGGNLVYCDDEFRLKYPDGFEFSLPKMFRPLPAGVTPGAVMVLSEQQFEDYLTAAPQLGFVGIQAPFVIVGPADAEGNDTALSEQDASELLRILTEQVAVRDAV